MHKLLDHEIKDLEHQLDYGPTGVRIGLSPHTLRCMIQEIKSARQKASILHQINLIDHMPI